MLIRYSLLLALVFLFSRGQAQNNFTKYFNEAAQSLDQNDFNTAIEKFSKALENKNDASNNYKIADTYIYRGYCRCRLKNYKNAISDIDEAIKIKPEYMKAYSMKVMVLFQEGKYEECIVWCDKGLEKKPNTDDLLFTKSDALFALKKYEESRKTAFILVENNPKNIAALRQIGSTCNYQKLWDSAIVYFSKAIEIDPLDHASYYDRGIGKSYLNDIEGATVDIQKGMQLDTANKFVGYNNLGFFLKLEKKEYAAAIEYFDKSIELKPDFAYAYSNRGFAKLNLNDIKGAYKDLRKSIELDNTNSYAFKKYGPDLFERRAEKNCLRKFQKGT